MKQLLRPRISPAEDVDAKPVTIITSRFASESYWLDVWRHRELILFLAWRDLVVRYKQTVVGIAWTILKPLTTLVVYTFIFGRVAGLPSHGIPYVLLVLSGLMPWQLFSTVFSMASESLITNSHLVSKVYFPRIIIPVSSVAISVVDNLVAFVLMAVLMLWYGMMPGWQVLLLPFVMLLAVLAALGIGLIIAVLNAQFRDFRQLIPFAMQLGIFVSPVAYATSVLPEKWRILYALNPVVGIIDSFRWCILGEGDLIYPPSIIFTLVFAAVTMVAGIKIFRRHEADIADVM
ncbi:MAG: ABC transporter permease [Rhizobium sp.]|nr:ABC transporter permease [Rhizobium sp.]